MSKILQNIDLAPLTSFRVGGKAHAYLKLDSAQEFQKTVANANLPQPWWLLGSGSNILISDEGLTGLTLHFQGGQITYQAKEQTVISDSGVIWDDLVLFVLQHELWGIELMSGIPGTVGGAVAININAYGQALADTLKWVDIYDLHNERLRRVDFQKKDWAYKKSPLAGDNFVILRMALQLAKKPTTKLDYAPALHYADEHNLNHNSLKARRKIIIGTRAKAGSLLNDTPVGRAKTCGSFFRNPIVRLDQIENLIAHDEMAFARKDLIQMNKLHGGQSNRVSAAHVLLAAGFKRGQTFDRVRLHPSHVLKIENYRQASAQEIYDVAKFIQKTVKMKLGITLEFEVKTLGKFLRSNKNY